MVYRSTIQPSSSSDGTGDIGGWMSCMFLFAVVKLEVRLDEDPRVTRGAGLSCDIWTCGLAFFNLCRADTVSEPAATSFIRVTLGLSRSFLARIFSLRSLRFAAAFPLSVMFLREMGPLQLVTTVDLIVDLLLRRPLPGRMGGATFGAGARSLPCMAMTFSIVLESRRSLRGLRGGGGPGLSEGFGGYKLDAKLEARLCRSGWLPILRGQGDLISMLFPSPGYLTGNASLGSAIGARANRGGNRTTGWLDNARVASYDCLNDDSSSRSKSNEAAPDASDAFAGDGALDAAARTGDDECWTVRSVEPSLS